MSAILIVLVLLVGVVLAASLALGRATHEVDSVRETEFVELEDTWVRYGVIGGGPPVVLVHGWLSSSRVWEGLAGRLAQRFTVYTLDLSGFGDSDKPLSGYGVRYGSRLLYSFCAHFGLTRANVIGHDLGGDMAVKLAADHQDIVGRLVLVNVPADEDQIDLPTPLWLATLPVVGPLFYALGRAVRPVRKLWMRPFVLDPDDLTEEVIDDAGRSTPAAVSKTLSIGRREIARGRLARQARIVKIPTLLVAGEDDQIVDPQAVGTWASSIDRSEVCLLDGCGHIPMIERTAEFNAQVLAFLTGDARYLEYAQTTPAAEEDLTEDATTAGPEDEVPEDGTFREEDPRAYPATDPAGTSDDAADLPLRGDGDREPGGRTGRTGDQPNVRRKQGGVYPAKGGSDPAVSSNGTENGAEEPGRLPGRPRRGTPGTPGTSRAGGDAIPELPDDLFNWPEPRRSREPRPDRHREGEPPASPEDNVDGAEGPPGPPRF